MKNTIIAIVVTFIIAGGIGYSVGMNAEGMDTNPKDAEDSIAMMKEQAASIEKMGEMMKTSGVMMQELGAKYKDDMMMSKGKDLEAVGGKYLQDNTSATKSSDMMEEVMGN